MHRATTLLSILFTFVGLGFSQEGRPSPQSPEDAFTTRQLIAWSGVQKPQPAPQPLPPRDTPVPEPDQPQDQQSVSPGNPHSEQTPTTQSFVGKIVKDGGKYLLKSGNKEYQLEEQGGLQKYENQPVRVLGTLDSTGETIRVAKIDLLS